MSKLAALFHALLALLFGSKTEETAAPLAPPPATDDVTPMDTYALAGDASVDGIYAHFADKDPAATKVYDNLDPTIYPGIWIRRTGTVRGLVVWAVRVDGRYPADGSEYLADDIDYAGEHSNVVVPYPKYGPYRTEGLHEVVVMLGRLPDGETNVSKVQWIREYPFDVRIKVRA